MNKTRIKSSLKSKFFLNLSANWISLSEKSRQSTQKVKYLLSQHSIAELMQAMRSILVLILAWNRLGWLSIMALKQLNNPGCSFRVSQRLRKNNIAYWTYSTLYWLLTVWFWVHCSRSRQYCYHVASDYAVRCSSHRLLPATLSLLGQRKVLRQGTAQLQLLKVQLCCSTTAASKESNGDIH